MIVRTGNNIMAAVDRWRHLSDVEGICTNDAGLIDHHFGQRLISYGCKPHFGNAATSTCRKNKLFSIYFYMCAVVCTSETVDSLL